MKLIIHWIIIFVLFQRRLELHRRRGRLWAHLRRNKEEARRWTRLVEMFVTNGLEIMDPQPIYPALASLTGSRTQFLIKEKKVFDVFFSLCDVISRKPHFCVVSMLMWQGRYYRSSYMLYSSIIDLFAQVECQTYLLTFSDK